MTIIEVILFIVFAIVILCMFFYIRGIKDKLDITIDDFNKKMEYMSEDLNHV